MRKVNKIIIILALICFIAPVRVNADDQKLTVDAPNIDVEVKFNAQKNEFKIPETSKEPEQDNTYKPPSPVKTISKLPHTGEVIGAFLFVMTGLSIMLIVIGVAMLRNLKTKQFQLY